ncbi:MAG: hypothetical protein M1817_003337 [Caeruleum heppii]|nr:MAG: hypothetical protein M1817_003337 [Caeruleum heppii]
MSSNLMLLTHTSRSFIPSVVCPKPQYFHRTFGPYRSSLVNRAPSRAGPTRSQHHFHSSPVVHKASVPPKTDYRGPPSSEDTQTDFSKLDVLNNTAAPSSAIDACLHDGFHLSNGTKVTGGSGMLLVSGEAFNWRPWEAGKGKLINERGQWGCDEVAWGVLDLVWPKPDLLILGLGHATRPITPETRAYINSLGIKIDIQDTRNAAAQFNLLATERGVDSICGAFLPTGWRDRA